MQLCKSCRSFVANVLSWSKIAPFWNSPSKVRLYELTPKSLFIAVCRSETPLFRKKWQRQSWKSGTNPPSMRWWPASAPFTCRSECTTLASRSAPHAPSRRSASSPRRRWERTMCASTPASTSTSGPRVSGKLNCLQQPVTEWTACWTQQNLLMFSLFCAFTGAHLSVFECVWHVAAMTTKTHPTNCTPLLHTFQCRHSKDCKPRTLSPAMIRRAFVSCSFCNKTPQ